MATAPNPANSRFPTERFIARLISSVRIVPEDPTRVPATIRATLSSANPAAAAARPVNAFKSEITTGMSAPPIGSTNRFPSSAAAIRTAMNSACEGSESWLAASTTQPARIPASRMPLKMCWPGKRIGRPEISSWSFAKAMFEPQNETEPTTSENRIGIRTSSGISPPSSSRWRNSAHEISAAAPPPTPL